MLLTKREPVSDVFTYKAKAQNTAQKSISACSLKTAPLNVKTKRGKNQYLPCLIAAGFLLMNANE